MSSRSMPVSPHIGIYRWQITMMMSIMHRASGVVLFSGALGLAYWLVALALGPGAFAHAAWFFHTWLGQALLCVWSLAFFYHLLNGIRHMCWDMGYGFTRRAYYTSGWLVVTSAIALTAAAWIFGWLLLGGGA